MNVGDGDRRIGVGDRLRLVVDGNLGSLAFRFTDAALVLNEPAERTGGNDNAADAETDIERNGLDVSEQAHDVTSPLSLRDAPPSMLSRDRRRRPADWATC